MKAIRYIAVALLLMAILAACGGESSATEDVDLSGDWQGVLTHELVDGGCPPTPPQQGTVRIQQVGSDMTLQFGEGFMCEPAEACAFTGSVRGMSFTASNGGSADQSGGVYATTMDLSISPGGDSAMGTGTSTYTHPELQCEWNTSLSLTRQAAD